MSRKFLRYVGPITGLCLFIAALWVLHRELHNYRDVVAQLRMVGFDRVGLGMMLTVLSYAVLTLYDSLAFRYIKQPMPYHKIAFGSFLGYVFSHNMGLSVVGASAARLRVYSSWGITPLEIAKIVVFCSMTFWLGFGVMGSLVFLVQPMEVPPVFNLGVKHAWPLGILFLALTAAYLSFILIRRRPFHIRGWQVEIPSRRITFAQIGLSVVDWFLFGGVLFVLLPPGHNVPLLQFMSVFLLAEAAALASHVPGGIGVLDAVILLLLTPQLEPSLGEGAREAVVASLVVYRGIYYLIPLIIATAMLGVHELVQRRKVAARPAAQLGPIVIPNLLSVAVFVAGSVLLLSGAIPENWTRLHAMRTLLSYGFTEVSHFTSTLVGMGLLVIARGLQRRLSGAYVWGIVLLAAGIVLSLGKGFDYLEAGFLTVVLLGLIPARQHFYRKASLASQWFTPGWITGICIVLVASIWVGIFSFRIRFESWQQLWEQFTLFGVGSAPRFWRGAAGAIALASFLVLWRLMRPSRHVVTLPAPEILQDVAQIVQRSSRAKDNLALAGDKELLFSPSRRTFVMFTTQGRDWVAFGDPVGPDDEKTELAWQFRELGDRNGGFSVFYAVEEALLPLYLEMGLSTFKIGEEALVPLPGFSLDQPRFAALAAASAAATAAGCTFEVVPAPHSPQLLADLKAVSDDWLQHGQAHEKAFAIGFFDPAYLQRFPLALVRQNGAVVAFANLWTTAQKQELMADFVRYRRQSPPEILDFLFVQLALWGRQQGFDELNLGMAPLSDAEESQLADLWNQIACGVFRHGEHFYNFQAIRQHKAKFDPHWRARYIASPGGLALPRVLRSVASIISADLRDKNVQP